MNDISELHTLEQRVDNLDSRVDDLQQRVTAVEVSITDMRRECNTGFTDIKNQLNHFMQERANWGVWMRGSFDKVGKFVAKWGGVLIIASIGFNQLPNVIKLFTK